jgi:hypothetical protein
MKIDKEKLNDAMASKGIFVRDLCKLLNMTEPTLKKLLSCGGDVDTGTASRIAHALDVPMVQLEEKSIKTFRDFRVPKKGKGR